MTIRARSSGDRDQTLDDEGDGRGQHTLMVTNPSRRDLVLVSHTDLTIEDAEELVAIYLAIGYGPELLRVTAEEQRAAA